MKRILLALSLLLAVAVRAQELTVKSMTIEPMDLSASKYVRNDLNGKACALVKVQIPLEGMVFEGNVLGDVENKAGEYWVYLTAGTKFFQIKHSSVSPLFLKFADFGLKPLASRTTYVLRLTAPERAMAKDPSMPVAMASKTDPMFPDWWNVTDDGLYVGISPPSYDGKSAKSAALLNAMSLYAQSSDQAVIFEAQYENKSGEIEKDKVLSKYLMEFTGISMDIFQEYYNSKGEYFVMCSIRKNPESSDNVDISWEFESFTEEDKRAEGSIIADLRMAVTIDGQHLYFKEKCFTSWSNNDYSMRLSCGNIDYIDGSSLVNGINLEIGGEGRGRFYLAGSPGICQSRLLNAFPCLPDWLWASVNSRWDGEEGESKASFFGKGSNRPKKIRLFDSDGNKTYFSITDAFPPDFHPGMKPGTDNTGLSHEYVGLLGSSSVTCGMGQWHSGHLEARKNMSLILALTELAMHYDVSFFPDNLADSEQIERKIPMITGVYPLWLLDDDRLDKFNKKKQDDLISNRSRLSENSVVVVVTGKCR